METDNPEHLLNDVRCEIIGDSLVECWIKNIVPNKLLIPRIEFTGTSVAMNGIAWEEGKKVDFKTPVTLIVDGPGGASLIMLMYILLRGFLYYGLKLKSEKI